MQSLNTWLRPLIRSTALRSSTSTLRASPVSSLVAAAASTRSFASSSCCCDSTPSSSSSSSSSATTTTTATTTAPTPASLRRPTTSTGPTEKRFDLSSTDLRYLQNLNPHDLTSFDPILDIHPSKKHVVAPHANQKSHVTVIRINDDPVNRGYQQPHPSLENLDSIPGEDNSIAHLSSVTQLSPFELRQLFFFPLITKRVVNMKSKGKIPAMYSLVVVGNGKGLVGVGEGKDSTAQKAIGKAYIQAVRSMDYVERYEDRTVWGTMQSNFGSCQIQMRSRPPGFGLRVNHYIHQVAKAAGISDLSAKVYGSRNGTRVIKLAIAMLHGGSTPVDMGGFGMTKGQRKNKKTKGMETAEEVARMRGRKPFIF